ncbi:MAG: hypothetical protein A2140_04410 [Candidatus Muproteobacteria bacterium RBG_16_62_13]|uniref:Uncharacterized protein n=1 Tax=Candidatus Muproteobacteria bacterium RBG_16_62_13 TaxID=1817756 RepID=A0A1F6T7X1_9PROT|nr:MAG: hypothetical protein A2140_04410 [Candidatus Muproteobacteria bacterium RBG_16_62_13]
MSWFFSKFFFMLSIPCCIGAGLVVGSAAQTTTEHHSIPADNKRHTTFMINTLAEKFIVYAKKASAHPAPFAVNTESRRDFQACMIMATATADKPAKPWHKLLIFQLIFKTFERLPI